MPTGVGPSRFYALFAMADQKHCTVTKLLTGKDAPLSNVEVSLQNTYAIATKRFEQQNSKGKKK